MFVPIDDLFKGRQPHSSSSIQTRVCVLLQNMQYYRVEYVHVITELTDRGAGV